MGNYKFFGGILTLAGVKLITACSQITPSNQSDLVTVLCKTDQSCITHYNEQTWQGEKRRQIIKQVAQSINQGKTPPASVELQDFETNHFYIINASATWHFDHAVFNSLHKYYDKNSHEEVAFNQLLDPTKTAKLEKTVRSEFKNALVNHKFGGMWNVPNENEYEKWLDDHVTQSLAKYGTFIQDKSSNTLMLKYCTANGWSDQGFEGCIQFPAKPFLKP